MLKCLKGLAPAYPSDFCVWTSAAPGRPGLRSAARGDLDVPVHRTELGSICLLLWLVRNVGINCLRDLWVGHETFARHLKHTFYEP